MKKIFGVAASSGIAIGKAWVFAQDAPEAPCYAIEAAAVDGERRRFEAAAEAVGLKLRARLAASEQEGNGEEADILKMRLLMVEDVDLKERVLSGLQKELKNVECVLCAVAGEMAERLLAVEDAYLRERAADISDVAAELTNALLGTGGSPLEKLDEEVIVVARDMLPSDALAMDKRMVKALATDSGSRTSHTAILMRSFEIPAVLGLSNATALIRDGDVLIVNGDSGRVIVNPDAAELEGHRRAIDENERVKAEDRALSSLAARTADGERIALCANIELPEDAGKALSHGAEGVGLFRTEFLFMSAGGAADEEMQVNAYRALVRGMGAKPVRIRTCDMGGDKMLPALSLKEEKNPLLGWRAIRVSLAMPELFKVQLRAILRAAAGGNAEIMFPLVSGVEELDAALATLSEARAECRQKGQAVPDDVKVGVMIEVPSAALIADILAEKVDFFSIGTNDLIQYALAVDRGNEKVNYLARPTHPAILRLIKMTVDAAHRAGKKAAMCGELAGVPLYTPLLLGLGLDELSMAPAAIPRVKRVVRACKSADCRALAARALKCGSGQEVAALLDIFTAQAGVGGSS
ncbi:MAG: phosphoenolpyruvate--protein phosphotransferase [Spirochaetaceae bacterium]|jgi:phosphotransferase system enzyme I (PtsI)|nr:phosphoenolpyruvate--protein phosphotransferase [Spirochaetaceae bacterium]